MAAPGKRRREGDLLFGRCPREEPQLQAHCAEGIAHPGVSQMEGEGLADCLGCPAHTGVGASIPSLPLWEERIFAAGGDCKALPEYQQLSQGALAQCYPQAPQGRSQAYRKPKTSIKIVRIEQKEGGK